jgi:hypothetical protein
MTDNPIVVEVVLRACDTAQTSRKLIPGSRRNITVPPSGLQACTNFKHAIRNLT